MTPHCHRWIDHSTHGTIRNRGKLIVAIMLYFAIGFGIAVADEDTCGLFILAFRSSASPIRYWGIWLSAYNE